MLTEIQKIILTCLLGPEDKTAFARFQKNAKSGEYRADNLEKVRKTARDSARKRRKERPGMAATAQNRCRLKNPGRARATYQKYKKKRYHLDASFRLYTLLSGRLNKALKRGSATKSARTMDLTGCPRVWLEVHLESLFRPGMSWKNHGTVWQIDHIKPCAAFDLTDPEQQRICFHWTNLQPLFAAENLVKGDTYVR